MQQPWEPPCQMRCNRKRMTLTIRVAVHHVNVSQLDLHTSKTTVKLSTKGARRPLKLVRKYPNGMTCDDSQTTAKVEGNILVVEMPIIHLPQIVPGGQRQLEREAPAERWWGRGAGAERSRVGGGEGARRGDGEACCVMFSY